MPLVYRLSSGQVYTTHMGQITYSDVLQPTSPASTAAGASAPLLGANTSRSGLRICLDSAALQPVYLLLGPGTASATHFTVALAPGGSWNGRVSDAVWRGPVQFFSANAGIVGVAEV